MKNHLGNFDESAFESFMEQASEEYVFAACKDGEKMTFGKCQKVGGDKKKEEEVARNPKKNLNKLKEDRYQNSNSKKRKKKKPFTDTPPEAKKGKPWKPSFDSLLS